MSFLRTLKFSFLLGTLLAPLVIYLEGFDGLTINAVLWTWILLVLASLLLKLATIAVERGKEKAGKVGRYLGAKKPSPQTARADTPNEMPKSVHKNPRLNFLQEVTSLVYVGSYITTALGFLPALIVISMWDKLMPVALPGRLAVGIFGSITYAWLALLENKVQLRITMPVIGMPLKWFIVPATLFLVIYGDPSA